MPTLSMEPQRLAGPPQALPVPLAVGYALLYVLLDWLSFIHPMVGLTITPWNPQSALAVGLLLWRPRAWWLVWLAGAFSAAAVRGAALPWGVEVLSAAALAAGHWITAAALARWLGRRPTLGTRRQFVLFTFIVAGGALVTSMLHVAALSAFDIPEPQRVPLAIHRGWIGDVVGLLVTLPLILLIANAERRRAALAMLRTSEWWLIALVTLACIFAVFTRSTEEQFKFFYLLFVPVVWAAARFGVAGAVGAAALVQALLIASVQSSEYRPLTVAELQSLMAALAATGLLLGTTFEEREEADRNLRATLRLAAAGDMAAALAHELNQPLAALSAYARASQLLAERAASRDPALAQPLTDVAGKLVREAERASDVVMRLRNFFRDRATELELTSMGSLLDEVLASQAAQARMQQIALTWHCADEVPPAWLDRVQIGVVLRNLVANGIDAVTASAGGERQPFVRVSVACEDGGERIVVTVSDSGPGIAAHGTRAVFESRGSPKPGGMGIGLGICRSIVEAHGGTIWAEPGPGGLFRFTLPAAQGTHEAPHA